MIRNLLNLIMKEKTSENRKTLVEFIIGDYGFGYRRKVYGLR